MTVGGVYSDCGRGQQQWLWEVVYNDCERGLQQWLWEGSTVVLVGFPTVETKAEALRRARTPVLSFDLFVPFVTECQRVDY